MEAGASRPGVNVITSLRADDILLKGTDNMESTLKLHLKSMYSYSL